MSEQMNRIIAENKVIVIARKIYGEDLLRLAKALCAGGIQLMEVTFDQADPDCNKKTAQQISMLREALDGRMHFGAGTVMTLSQVDAAAGAGAEFMISPNTDESVIKYTKEKGLVSMPGAMTPSEMASAHNWGADFVKVFPICDLGIQYMKNVMAPISHIKFIATGSVSEQNLGEYLDIGMAGAGVGGRLTDKKLIAEGNFPEFTERAKKFCEIARTHGK